MILLLLVELVSNRQFQRLEQWESLGTGDGRGGGGGSQAGMSREALGGGERQELGEYRGKWQGLEAPGERARLKVVPCILARFDYVIEIHEIIVFVSLEPSTSSFNILLFPAFLRVFGWALGWMPWEYLYLSSKVTNGETGTQRGT